MLAWEQQVTYGPAAPAAHGHTTTLIGKNKSSRLVVFGGQGQDNSMCVAPEPMHTPPTPKPAQPNIIAGWATPTCSNWPAGPGGRCPTARAQPPPAAPSTRPRPSRGASSSSGVRHGARVRRRSTTRIPGSTWTMTARGAKPGREKWPRPHASQPPQPPAHPAPLRPAGWHAPASAGALHAQAAHMPATWPRAGRCREVQGGELARVARAGSRWTWRAACLRAALRTRRA